MIRKGTLLIALIFVLSFAMISFAQTGTFSGTVVDDEGLPIAGAEVELYEEGGCGGGGGGMGGGGGGMGGGGGGGGMQDPLYETETLEDGSFIIEGVDAGEYLAKAHLEEYGMESEEIEIFAGQTTVVDFVLTGCGGGGGGGGMGGGGCMGDSLVTVELSGTAMVEELGMMTHYYLDVDGDEEPDYQLSFGPSWYDPQSGAERPEDGDVIDIVGGWFVNSTNDMVIVYEINGLFWREPFGTTPGDLRRLRERRHSGESDNIRISVKMKSYPNPFNPETTISYELSDAANVNVAIFNSLGRQIVSLVNGSQNAGVHQIVWNAVDYSSGLYFIKMNVNGQTFTQQLLLTK